MVPSGAIGVLLKSKGPLRSSYADSELSRREVRSIFSVSWACSMNLSHSWMGQFLSIVPSPAMKWSLKVAIACSAALTRWLCASTSWISISFFVMYDCTVFEHSLSMTLSVGFAFFYSRY